MYDGKNKREWSFEPFSCASALFWFTPVRFVWTVRHHGVLVV